MRLKDKNENAQQSMHKSVYKNNNNEKKKTKHVVGLRSIEIDLNPL